MHLCLFIDERILQAPYDGDVYIVHNSNIVVSLTFIPVFLCKQPVVEVHLDASVGGVVSWYYIIDRIVIYEVPNIRCDDRITETVIHINYFIYHCFPEGIVDILAVLLCVAWIVKGHSSHFCRSFQSSWVHKRVGSDTGKEVAGRQEGSGRLALIGTGCDGTEKIVAIRFTMVKQKRCVSVRVELFLFGFLSDRIVLFLRKKKSICV